MALGNEVVRAGDPPAEEEDLVVGEGGGGEEELPPEVAEEELEGEPVENVDHDPAVYYDVEEVAVTRLEDDEEEASELVDPQDTRKETCSESAECCNAKVKFEACQERVSCNPGTEETCEEELFDFLHCVDKCVARCLFDELK